jgi:hypothetical protein
MASETITAGTLGRKAALTFLGLAMTTAALTTLFLSMRAIMEIGGSCVSGGPIDPDVVRQCPSGTPGLMIFSIFGGLIFLGVYAVNTFGLNLAIFAWPALFLSLGYNFFDYGINPPTGDGPVWGWLICGAIFFLMGGGPLAFGIWAFLDNRESRVAKAVASRPDTAQLLDKVPRPGRTRREHSWGVIDALERLSKMHQRGELDDGEYEAAKNQVLTDEEKTS